MSSILITKEFEFPAPVLPDLALELTATYHPEDEEWLVSIPGNYLNIIDSYFAEARRKYIRYIDNKLRYEGHDLAESWAKEAHTK